MKITMLGTGYVGLVSATCFAEMGHFVSCLDINENKIQQLKNGKIPIYEPLLEEMVSRNYRSKRLQFTLDPKEALCDSSICFIAVPTLSQSSGDADLSHVYSALDTIALNIQKDLVVIIKSTVPVGTTKLSKEYLDKKLKENKSSFSCNIGFNPEFLKEGCAVMDFLKPDRIIFGAEDELTINNLKKAYQPFTINHDRMIIMSINSAEMTKYAANVMLASRISLMNEFANFCEKVGANINDVRIGIGSDSRIGYQFLYAGTGYGGSCFPKDIKALKAMMKNCSSPSFMIDAIEKVNESQKLRLVEKVKNYFGSLNGKIISILGLSFKPETDDLREAPSITIIKELKSLGATLRLFDPISMSLMQEIFPTSQQISYFEDEYSSLNGSDALLLVTEWKQFRQLDFDKISATMRTKSIFDGRNQYQRNYIEDLGFYYDGIGT